MNQESNERNYDQEIAAMNALATVVAPSYMLPVFTYPASSTLEIPGLVVVATDGGEIQNANS